jgi:probable H4MPT-linked C1 transfer pathway protein
MALTMTAELSDVFATRREGVLFVLDCMQAAFPGCQAYALSLAGEFTPLVEACVQPLDFAAANWLATASWIARTYPDCLLIDVGSTTTDIIPIIGGHVAAEGRTDLARLQAGELLYTGMLRTHLAAIVQAVPVHGQLCPVSSEYFAISGDAHLVHGDLAPEDYTCPTPDGRPATALAARARLARLVCADIEQLGDAQIDTIAAYICEQQLGQISRGMFQVLSRSGGRRDLEVIAVGLGAGLGEQAARRLGLAVSEGAARWEPEVSAVAPSWAVAQLLVERLGAG